MEELRKSSNWKKTAVKRKMRVRNEEDNKNNAEKKKRKETSSHDKWEATKTVEVTKRMSKYIKHEMKGEDTKDYFLGIEKYTQFWYPTLYSSSLLSFCSEWEVIFSLLIQKYVRVIY